MLRFCVCVCLETICFFVFLFYELVCIVPSWYVVSKGNLKEAIHVKTGPGPEGSTVQSGPGARRRVFLEMQTSVPMRQWPIWGSGHEAGREGKYVTFFIVFFFFLNMNVRLYQRKGKDRGCTAQESTMGS